MTVVFQKARWLIFGGGLLLIAVGGFGYLIGAPWANSFGSLSTIFGTMLSFAQMFVAFPTTTIHLPHHDMQNMSATQPQADPTRRTDYVPPAQSPRYQQATPPAYPYAQPIAPPPPYAVYQPSSAYAPPPPGAYAYAAPPVPQSLPKRYKWSGIGFWVGAVCALLQIYALMTLSGAHTLQDVYDYYSVVFLQGVCVLLSLRSVHARHARQAGAPGIVAIMVVGGALLLNVIGSGIYVGAADPVHYTISTHAQDLAVNFLYVNSIFLVLGYILLGISFLRGKVYAIWIGVVGVIFGCVAFTLASVPGGPVPSEIATVGLLCACLFHAAVGSVLFKKPRPAPVSPYRVR